MEDRRVWGVGLGVLLIGARVLLALGRSSSHHSYSSPSYTPPPSYPSSLPSSFGSGLDHGGLDMDERMKVEGLVRELAAEAKKYVGQCRGRQIAFLEVQPPELADALAVFREATTPAGTHVPALSTHGLRVVPVEAFVEEGDVNFRFCGDTSASYVEELTHGDGPGEKAVSAIAPGAWLVKSSPLKAGTPASAALVTDSMLARFTTKGPLVAIAPTDHAVAFVDSANPAAVLAGAKAVAAELAKGEDTSFQSDRQLVLKNGAWAPWSAPASHVAAKALAELNRDAHQRTVNSMLGGVEAAKAIHSTYEVLAQLSVKKTGIPADCEVDEGEPAPRSETDVTTVNDGVGLEPQLVGESSSVEFADDVGTPLNLAMPWPTFAASAKLRPFHAGGVVVPYVFTFEGRVDLKKAKKVATP